MSRHCYIPVEVVVNSWLMREYLNVIIFCFISIILQFLRPWHREKQRWPIDFLLPVVLKFEVSSVGQQARNSRSITASFVINPRIVKYIFSYDWLVSVALAHSSLTCLLIQCPPLTICLILICFLLVDDFGLCWTEKEVI